MSDTPSTDAHIKDWKSSLKFPDDLDEVIEFARELERELAEAKRIGSFNAEESLKWRTLFQNERDENEWIRGELHGIAEYRAANPLGGPAKMFDAIADRIRAGEEYYAVLADYDVTVLGRNRHRPRRPDCGDGEEFENLK